MLLFQLVQGNRLNPMNNGKVRDVLNKPVELKRNLETLSRAKKQLKTLEKLAEEAKSSNKEKKEGNNMVKIKTKYSSLTEALASGREVSGKNVKVSEVDAEIIITTILSKMIDTLESYDIIPKEFSKYLALKEELLNLVGKYISTELEDFEEYLKFTKEEKKEISKFLNDFDDVADKLVSAYIKGDVDKVLDEIEIPKCLVKSFINISKSDKELNLEKLQNLINTFDIDNGINIEINKLIKQLDKLESKENNKSKNTKFINPVTLTEKLVEYFNLPLEDIVTLLNNNELSFEDDNFKNEFIISGDKLIECKFTNKETNEVINKTMLFDEKGLVYEN